MGFPSQTMVDRQFPQISWANGMRPGWRVGTIFGIPLFVDTSWFLILGLMTLLNSSGLQRQGLSPGMAWIVGLALALLLFGSVLLHELGHSLVARSQGITVNSISLFIFGGIASLDQESKTPGQAFQVAIAGPAVSFVLFVLLLGLAQFIPDSTPINQAVQELAWINGVLALFNMIPGLPLDGGQVLKSIVWKISGSRLKGMRWAARSGQWFGWTAIAFALMLYLQTGGRAITLLWIALIGWFIVSNASTYNRVAELQEAVAALHADRAMTREFRVVDANLDLQKFTDDYVLREEGLSPAFFAASDGRYRGMVRPEDLQEIERSEWTLKTLNNIVHPLSEIPTVRETTPLAEVIEQLESLELKRITVLSPAGAVAGMIDRGDIVRAVAEKLKVPIPDTFIKQIKEEGAYPPGLPLQMIAKSINETPVVQDAKS